jgi:hypothetical protein
MTRSPDFDRRLPDPGVEDTTCQTCLRAEIEDAADVECTECEQCREDREDREHDEMMDDGDDE